MKMALKLASRGFGMVSPNPPVGAVIVNDGKIIGEGYHALYGGDHAEVMALKQAGEAARGGTIYVTLEPCTITGKTPPCAKAVIEAGLSMVVIAVLDPNPAVHGNGVEQLESAGIEVKTGVLQPDGDRLIRGFRKLMLDGEPFITLKIATTADNYVARNLGGESWFTSQESKCKVHIMRNEHDAVLVGINTAAENPSLTVREVEGVNPIRVVLDRLDRLPENLKLFSDDEAKTIKFSSQGISGDRPWGEHVVVAENDGGLSLRSIMDALGKRGVTSVLVEGGPRLQKSFFDEGLADEIALFTSPHQANSDVHMRADFKNLVSMPAKWHLVEELKFGSDHYQISAR